MRTKTKWERSLQQSNLKAKAVFEHHEVLGKLIQEGAEKLQTVETLRKGPSGNTLQANYEYLKTPTSAYSFSCRAGHQSFKREGPLPQSGCRLDPSTPTRPNHRELWKSLAKACLCRGSASPFMGIWRCSSFFLQSSAG